MAALGFAVSHGTTTMERESPVERSPPVSGRNLSRDASQIRVVVPNRVDLAGGTLDIYPLYLMVPGSMTVNAAIGMESRVEAASVRGSARLYSEDFSFGVRAAD